MSKGTFKNGYSIELGNAWTLRKGTKTARCVLLITPPISWELRLIVGELLLSQTYCSSKEIRRTQESWKAAMLVLGWDL
jgi:hypothetical protein